MERRKQVPKITPPTPSSEATPKPTERGADTYELVSEPWGEFVMREPRTATGWQALLDSTPQIHGGDTSWTANAGELLHAFTQGKDYAVNRAHELGVAITRPRTVILTGDNPGGYSFAHGGMEDGESVLLVNRDKLKTFLAPLHSHPNIRIKDQANEDILFQGTATDYAFLSGVHEMRHSADFQLGTSTAAKEGYTSQTETSLDYFAQTDEYYAKKEELAAAQRLGLPQHTKDVLRNYLLAVRNHRREQQELARSAEQPSNEQAALPETGHEPHASTGESTLIFGIKSTDPHDLSLQKESEPEHTTSSIGFIDDDGSIVYPGEDTGYDPDEPDFELAL